MKTTKKQAKRQKQQQKKLEKSLKKHDKNVTKVSKKTAAGAAKSQKLKKSPPKNKGAARKDVLEDIFSNKSSSDGVSKSVRHAKKTVKEVNQKSAYQRRARKDVKKRKKAEYLSTLPKSPVKRMLDRFNLKRAIAFMFSKRGLILFAKLFAVGLILMLVLVGGMFAYFRRDLDIYDVENRSQKQTTIFYDRTGEHVLYELYGEENRKVIEFDEISQYVKDATIAIEDKDFYDHRGFSVRGVTRATYNNLTGGPLQGGSTITQQFIKNSLLTNERRITRKIKELILSVELERKFTKDEILALYLNEVAYGGQSYGIEAASLSYFDKSAKDLTLDEAAMLAALPQQPGNYDPYNGPLKDSLPIRQDLVLQLMADQGYVTQAEANEAKEIDTFKKLVPLEEKNAYENIKAPHFVLEVQKQLGEKYGEQVVASGGLKVITTVDLDLQEMAEKAVADNIFRIDNVGGNNAALVSADSKTNQVLAMVGSRDFRYKGFGAYNASTAYRQPGSSYKPYVYATLFKSPDWGPGSIMYDVKTNFGGSPGYVPRNFSGNFNGAMTIRRSLGQSLNIPAVKAGYIAGIENVVEQANSMGAPIIEQDYYGLGITLGAGEIRLADHITGYSTFANSGLKNDQVYVLEVTNPKGEVIEKWQPQSGEKVLDEQIAYLVTSMLSDINNAGSRSYFIPGVQHTVKTGTTNEFKDGWMMGYSGCLTTGVWVGNNEPREMRTASTSFQTGPIWRQYMANAHTTLNGKDCSLQAQPAGIKTLTLDRVTGKIPSGETKNGTVTDKFPSWYRAAKEDGTKTNVYDSVSGFLATDCTPEAARVTYTSGGITPEIPATDPSYSNWLSPIAALAAKLGVPIGGDTDTIKEDDVHKCSDKEPEVQVTAEAQGGSTYEITVIFKEGTHPLETVEIKAEDQTLKTYSVSGSGTRSFTHTFTQGGSILVSATAVDEALYSGNSSVIVSVANGAGSLSVSASSSNSQINWTGITEAASYEVCVDSSNPPSTCYTVSASSTSYSPVGLTGTNYVRVRAFDASGTELASSGTVSISN